MARSPTSRKYGAEILALALDILHRRPVPPAIFVKHQLVTPENVDHIYPNDRLLQLSGGSDSAWSLQELVSLTGPPVHLSAVRLKEEGADGSHILWVTH